MKRARGFTLVELIVVIVLIGIMAGTMIMYFRPALLGFLAANRRATLVSQADSAIRMMSSEIRSAVPNSLRVAGVVSSGGTTTVCFELLPTSDGGRYRTDPDTERDAAIPGESAYIDMSQAVTQFDVLTSFTTTPVAGDYVVIGNQNVDDAYTLSNVQAISQVAAPPSAAAPKKPLGTSRITLTAAKQFPAGYDGGRFYIIPKAKQAVTYLCSNPGMSSGTGTGTLYRFSGYGFNTALSCPTPTSTTPKLASKVGSCRFTYNPTGGATQESGYMQVQLKLSDDSESVNLNYGVHVDNVP